MSLAFRPVGILVGLLAGIVGKKVFELVWGLIDDEDPPEAKYRQIGLIKLVGALALEGAIFRALRGLADHGARHAFARLAGEWPGDERPEPKED
jgi:xanthosine utilization system XapX-like protein